MKFHCLFAALSMASATLFSVTPSAASAGPIGEWRVADGSATVSIRPCGTGLCGFVATAKDHQASTVGRQVFFSLKPRSGHWSGTIVNIIDGQHYAGHISLLGSQTLRVEGCVMGGMICGGQQWARVH